MKLDKPMDINLVHYSANDITTAECRINNVIIPKTVLDKDAQSTLMCRKLARRIGLKVDTSNPISLEGVSTDSKAYGICYNVPITFTNKSLSRDTDFILECDIIIIDYDKYALIIGTDWLNLAGGKVNYAKRKFRVGNTFVPISVHRLSIENESKPKKK